MRESGGFDSGRPRARAPRRRRSVRGAIGLHDEPRAVTDSRCGDALALADRIADESVVRADLATVDRHERPGLRAVGVALEDEAAVVAVDEAQVHRIRLVGDVDTQLARELSRPLLREFAERR